MNLGRWLLVLAAAVVVSLIVIVVAARQATRVEEVAPAEAAARLEAVRAHAAQREPLIAMDDSGNFVRREMARSSGAPNPKRLCLLVYRPAQRRLVKVDVPFWYYKAKSRGIEFMTKGQGVDLQSLGVTAPDLERHGAGIVLDMTKPNGDHVLLWTE